MKNWLEYRELRGTDNTVTGRVVVWPGLETGALLGPRDIAVYLPPSLAAWWKPGSEPSDRDRRYPVLYFHDGQNVFDDRTSHVGEWQADETLQKLAGEGLEAIAVAIPNSADRMDEYNPWRSDVEWHKHKGKMGGKGDAYLAWLVSEVKSLIDRSFPTRLDRSATGLVGSSMGGLISLYGLIAHPDLFGLAGVLSPSLGWSDYRVLSLIEAGKLPRARIHVDMGGREWRGMTRDARRLRDLLLTKGWVEGRDLHYVEERYAPHHETAWARRLPDALRFLLAGTAVAAVTVEAGPEPAAARA